MAVNNIVFCFEILLFVMKAICKVLVIEKINLQNRRVDENPGCWFQSFSSL